MQPGGLSLTHCVAASVCMSAHLPVPLMSEARVASELCILCAAPELAVVLERPAQAGCWCSEAGLPSRGVCPLLLGTQLTGEGPGEGGERARRCLSTWCPQSCFPGDPALGAAARPGCPGRFENHRCTVDAPPASRSVGTGQAVSIRAQGPGHQGRGLSSFSRRPGGQSRGWASWRTHSASTSGSAPGPGASRAGGGLGPPSLTLCAAPEPQPALEAARGSI